MKLQLILILVASLFPIYKLESQFLQQTNCRNGLNISIQQNATTKDSVLVNTGACVVYDLNVILDTILHTWDSDLIVYIQKGNTGVQLLNRIGGSGDNFINTKLDDSASILISEGTAPFSGNYRPINSLHSFYGINPNGYWRLLVSDTASGDTGIIKAWCVQLTISCVTGGLQSLQIPNTFRLYQNYPNPFNPVTKIKYGMPKNGNVKLTVYDELGKEVDVLVDNYKEANTYEAEFNATNLPSGVYYYKLEADGFSDTKKMVIIK